MTIIEEKYIWNGALVLRDPNTSVFLAEHHAAANGSAQDIHRNHVAKNWRGIAYNYYIRKDGTIYRGRPENTYGGHTANHHHDSIGICYEGNFEIEQMTPAQMKAGRWLTADIKRRYPGIKVVRHSELNATACPGKNFPFAEITKKDDGEIQVAPIAVLMNGQRVELAGILYKDENYVRIRSLADAQTDDKLTVSWDAATRTVIINSK